jgi:hypothetical protein
MTLAVYIAVMMPMLSRVLAPMYSAGMRPPYRTQNANAKAALRMMTSTNKSRPWMRRPSRRWRGTTLHTGARLGSDPGRAECTAAVSICLICVPSRPVAGPPGDLGLSRINPMHPCRGSV